MLAPRHVVFEDDIAQDFFFPQRTPLAETEASGEWASDPEPHVDLGGHVPAVDPAIYGIDRDDTDVHAIAAEGIATPSTTLPHAERIQAAFGAHDISGIQAHVGGGAASAIGATAYATGSHVVFDRAPDLHTAAHEAAHVVQQARGVNLYGGVGEAGDSYERAADAVADRVVAGQSAADLLGAPATSGAAPAHAVQREELTRDQHVRNAAADRGTAISAQLRLGALQIQGACDDIEAVMAGPTGELGGEGVMQSMILPAFERANAVQRTLTPIADEMLRTQFFDTNVREGLGIFNAARRRLIHTEAAAKRWAGSHGATTKGIGSSGPTRVVEEMASVMHVDADGYNAITGTEKEGTTEQELVVEAVHASLGAIESSSTALTMTMREADPRQSAPAVIRNTLSDLRMLDASIPANARTSEATLAQIARVSQRMEQAWIEGQPFGFQQDGTMIQAIQLARTVRKKLEAARGKGKSKK